MSDTDNRSIDRLEKFVERLERVMYGDDYARQPGLLTQVDELRKDIAAVSNDVQAARSEIHSMRSKRANVWLWVLGYVTFLISGMFAMSAFYSMPEIKMLLAMPAPVAVALAVVFAVAALLLFAGGFGWLTHGD